MFRFHVDNQSHKNVEVKAGTQFCKIGVLSTGTWVINNFISELEIITPSQIFVSIPKIEARVYLQHDLYYYFFDFTTRPYQFTILEVRRGKKLKLFNLTARSVFILSPCWTYERNSNVPNASLNASYYERISVQPHHNFEKPDGFLDIEVVKDCPLYIDNPCHDYNLRYVHPKTYSQNGVKFECLDADNEIIVTVTEVLS